jgi:adenylate cyclase class 2
MLEIEMKFPVPCFTDVEERLRKLGVREVSVIQEADHYYNAPDRDFARTDEALRLRRIGTANFVTYKGPKRDPQTKTRTEVEVPLAGGDATATGFMTILEHLKYRPSGVVRKQRRIGQLERNGFPLEICLDEVEGLGCFVELEIVAPEEQLEEGRAVLLNLAAELGLKNQERRSYLELTLAAKGGKSP